MQQRSSEELWLEVVTVKQKEADFPLEFIDKKIQMIKECHDIIQKERLSDIDIMDKMWVLFTKETQQYLEGCYLTDLDSIADALFEYSVHVWIPSHPEAESVCNEENHKEEKFCTPEEIEENLKMEDEYEEVMGAEDKASLRGDVEDIIEMDETANQVAVIEISESLNFMDWPFKNLSDICKDDDEEVSFYRLFQEEILYENMIVKENCVKHSQEITTESDESIGKNCVNSRQEVGTESIQESCVAGMKEESTDRGHESTTDIVEEISTYNVDNNHNTIIEVSTTVTQVNEPPSRRLDPTMKSILHESSRYNFKAVQNPPRKNPASSRSVPVFKTKPESRRMKEVFKPPWMWPPQPTDTALMMTPPPTPRMMFYDVGQPPGQ